MKEYQYKLLRNQLVLLIIFGLVLGVISFYIAVKDNYLFYNILYSIIGCLAVVSSSVIFYSLSKEPKKIILTNNEIYIPKGLIFKSPRKIKLIDILNVEIREDKISGKDYLFIKLQKGQEYCFVKDGFKEGEAHSLYLALQKYINGIKINE